MSGECKVGFSRGFRSGFRFTRSDEVVGEHDAGRVREFAEVFLGPGVGIVEASLKFGGVERETAVDGVVDSDFGFEVSGRS